MTANRVISILVAGFALLLAACGSDGASDPGSTPQPLDPFAAATQDLSRRTGVPEGEIQMVSTSATNWPDACLGLAEPGEVCAQVITRGYRVVLEAGGKRYLYRTDLSSVARYEGEAP